MELIILIVIVIVLLTTEEGRSCLSGCLGMIIGFAVISYFLVSFLMTSV